MAGVWEVSSHSAGIQVLENGSQFLGHFKRGLQCGDGLFVTKEENGEHRYQGGFLNDEFDGRGVYKWPNGKFYDGEFSRGNSHGFGTMTWRNGFLFAGKFVDDSPLG